MTLPSETSLDPSAFGVRMTVQGGGLGAAGRSPTFILFTAFGQIVFAVDLYQDDGDDGQEQKEYGD